MGRFGHASAVRFIRKIVNFEANKIDDSRVAKDEKDGR